MSASRSVAAAQRRRAGPPEPQSNRGPNTSINSSQAFSQQQGMRPGTTGRLAGQQAAIQQQQYLQGQGQGQGQQNASKTEINKKMSVAQAITLITLRLGRLETQFQSQSNSGSFVNESGEAIDSNLIDSILQRLEMLEQEEKTTQIDNNFQEEIFKLKQQLENHKTSVISIRNSSAVNTKDIKSLKTELDVLRNEFLETKNIINELETLYNEKLDNNIEVNEDLDQQYINDNEYIDGPLEETETFINNDEITVSNNNLELQFEEDNIEEELDQKQNQDLDQNQEPVELEQVQEPISLKEIIQQELKQSGVTIQAPMKKNSKKLTK